MDDSSFYSLDRMLEFGFGLAIAQQMAGTMQHINSNMGSHLNQMNSSVVMPEQIFAVVDNKQAGPFSLSEVAIKINKSEFSEETLIWFQGLSEWKKLGAIAGLNSLLNQSPPPIPPTV